MTRIPIPSDTADAVLYAHAHTCCVCTEEGKPVQIHHIDKNASNNDLQNLAVLCLEDHDRAHLAGGFARHLSASNIAHYRDEWVARVQRRRDLADEIRVSRAVAAQLPSVDENPNANSWEMPSRHALIAYIQHLPGALAAAYEAEQEEFDSGVTSRMVHAMVRIADTLEQMWIYLAQWYPPKHFGKDPAQYIADYRAERANFHWAIAHVGGEQQGTIIRPIVASSITSSMDKCIEETVFALTRFDFEFDGSDWERRWQLAASGSEEKSITGIWKKVLTRFKKRSG